MAYDFSLNATQRAEVKRLMCYYNPYPNDDPLDTFARRLTLIHNNFYFDLYSNGEIADSDTVLKLSENFLEQVSALKQSSELQFIIAQMDFIKTRLIEYFDESNGGAKYDLGLSRQTGDQLNYIDINRESTYNASYVESTSLAANKDDDIGDGVSYWY